MATVRAHWIQRSRSSIKSTKTTHTDGQCTEFRVLAPAATQESKHYFIIVCGADKE